MSVPTPTLALIWTTSSDVYYFKQQLGPSVVYLVHLGMVLRQFRVQLLPCCQQVRYRPAHTTIASHRQHRLVNQHVEMTRALPAAQPTIPFHISQRATAVTFWEWSTCSISYRSDRTSYRSPTWAID